MNCSTCTGGGSLLKGRWLGSMTLTPSQGRNHNFPSEDLATCGKKWPIEARLLTPSELSKTVTWIVGFASLSRSTAVAQASNSVLAMRTRPHAVYNQIDFVLSSIDQ